MSLVVHLRELFCFWARVAVSWFGRWLLLPAGVLSLLWGQAIGSVIEGKIPLPDSSPSPAVMAKRYEIVSRGGVLSTIPPVGVVWLEGARSTQSEAPTVEIVQEDFLFHPALLPIEVGTVVEFPNADEEYHNVFSYSPTERFDLGRYMPEERPVPAQIFDTPGTVILRCDIHEHMRAIILVLDSSHFTTTDTKGHFRLDGLPAGEYLLKAWVDSETTLEKRVTLEDGDLLQISFDDADD